VGSVANVGAGAGGAAGAGGGAGGESEEAVVLATFASACRYIKGAEDISVSANDRLKLYAYYKQATAGPCREPRPQITDMRRRAMWCVATRDVM
jgi:hypothetical protein